MINFQSDKLPKGQEQQWINASTGTLLETQPHSLHFKIDNYTICDRLVEVIVYHQEQVSHSSQGH